MSGFAQKVLKPWADVSFAQAYATIGGDETYNSLIMQTF